MERVLGCDTKGMVHKEKKLIGILQILKLFSAKESVQGMEKQAIGCNKIFASHIFEKALMSGIHREL